MIVRPSMATLPAIVHMGDTHTYTEAAYQANIARRDWILANRVALNIVAVVHIGDFALDDANAERNWDWSDDALAPLDAVMPVIKASGNHDGAFGDPYNALTPDLFDGHMFARSASALDGLRTKGSIFDGSYTLLDIGTETWLVIALPWAVPDAALTWAQGIIAANPTLPIMLVVHGYLAHDGRRFDYDLYPNQQAFAPVCTPYGTTVGFNDGGRLWRALKNTDLRLVFCGHDISQPIGPSVFTLTSALDSGKPCYQMLANYQSDVLGDGFGGLGRMRLIRFDYPRGQMIVTTIQSVAPAYYLQESTNAFALPLAP